AFHGRHRKQRIWSNPEARPQGAQGLAFAKLMPGAAEADILNTPYGRHYFALFPSFFMLGTPLQNFMHVVYPLSATRSRGVIRIYWIGADRSAGERFGRESVLTMVRDIHAEDISVIEAGQRGLSSGALEHIHFQTNEALCRHLINGVVEQVEAWQARVGG
ncbi:MAG: aromatic ring-hydroxylating dioxygenase subunit alpha, partial [Alphaproteobacteria bacterium]|nr:aromatic ring-hydroxylating dioxygenase subunit alpha [Alphaproteobacteria bacterium]